MALQLNSILTKSLVTSLVRYGTTSARIILVSNAVPIPTAMTTAQLDTYFQSFMLTTNTANYLGSFTISAYQNFNNTIIIGSGSATALQSGTVGSIVLTNSSSTAAPVANTSATGYINARNRAFFITDSISTVDDPQVCVLDNLTLTAGSTFQHFSTTISMVSAA